METRGIQIRRITRGRKKREPNRRQMDDDEHSAESRNVAGMFCIRKIIAHILVRASIQIWYFIVVQMVTTPGTIVRTLFLFTQ